MTNLVVTRLFPRPSRAQEGPLAWSPANQDIVTTFSTPATAQLWSSFLVRQRFLGPVILDPHPQDGPWIWSQVVPLMASPGADQLRDSSYRARQRFLGPMPPAGVEQFQHWLNVQVVLDALFAPILGKVGPAAEQLRHSFRTRDRFLGPIPQSGVDPFQFGWICKVNKWFKAADPSGTWAKASDPTGTWDKDRDPAC